MSYQDEKFSHMRQGLQVKETMDELYMRKCAEIEHLREENRRYREALEKIADEDRFACDGCLSEHGYKMPGECLDFNEIFTIAKAALKGEGVEKASKK